VDRIDLRLLNLLAQRTRLAARIGEAKRREGRCIYVPAREQELLERVIRRAGRRVPPGALAAIFREIMSSSRAAQGQEPVGLLEGKGIETLMLAARRWLGACDRLETRPTLDGLWRDLHAGKLAFVLLSGADLLRAFAASSSKLAATIEIVGSFPGPLAVGLAGQVFTIIPGTNDHSGVEGDRHLVLIECKAGANELEKKLARMSLRQLTQPLILAQGTRRLVLFSLATATAASQVDAELSRVLENGKIMSLGCYRGSYGG
jgi:chorismate mutase